MAALVTIQCRKLVVNVSALRSHRQFSAPRVQSRYGEFIRCAVKVQLYSFFSSWREFFSQLREMSAAGERRNEETNWERGRVYPAASFGAGQMMMMSVMTPVMVVLIKPIYEVTELCVP